MLAFLEQVQDVLTGDNGPGGIMSFTPTPQVGVNLRKKPDQPAIEYGLETGSIEPGKKETQNLRVTVYGTASAEEVVGLADRVTMVLTPKNLSSVTRNLHCGLCQKTRNSVLPTSDFGHQVELTFRVLFTNSLPSH